MLNSLKTLFVEVPAKDKSKWTSSGMIGEAVGGSTLVLLILLVGMYVFLRKRRAERTENSKTLGKKKKSIIFYFASQNI